MAKLAAGTGMRLPDIATQALNTSAMLTGAGQSVASVAAAAQAVVQHQQQQLASMNPPIATQCFLLSNMFDPTTESAPNWDLEIRDDVIDECTRHGGVLHIYVDKSAAQGNVYVKCNSIAAAVASVNALHGRWFAGNDRVNLVKLGEVKIVCLNADSLKILICKLSLFGKVLFVINFIYRKFHSS